MKNGTQLQVNTAGGQNVETAIQHAREGENFQGPLTQIFIDPSTANLL